MSEQAYVDIASHELGIIGAWRILQAPDDWNDRYLWACDGYWLAPVCQFINGHLVATALYADDFRNIQQDPDQYTLQVRAGMVFRWDWHGQVDITSAYRIPRKFRTRGAT